MNKISRFLVPFLAAVLALILVMGVMDTQEAGADAITNHWTHTVATGATSYITTGGSLTGWDVAGYGSAVVHVIADASNTTSTLTVYPQYSNAVDNCTTVTDWFTGTDYVEYYSPASGALYQVVSHTPISYTVAVTTGGGTTTTTSYTYDPATATTYTVQAAASASAGFSSVGQSMSLTGNAYDGREFRVYGRCMRLKFAVSFGTITPTIYVMERDLYE